MWIQGTLGGMDQGAIGGWGIQVTLVGIYVNSGNTWRNICRFRKHLMEYRWIQGTLRYMKANYWGQLERTEGNSETTRRSLDRFRDN
jgi:hypothetical protein